MGGDLRSSEADALYRPLGDLDAWAAASVDGAAWDHDLRRMEELRTGAPHWADMTAFGTLVAAAHQSAALAGLYPSDRSTAVALVAGEATPAALGDEIGAHVRAGVAALVAATDGGVSEERLRRLHAIACAPQVTHSVDGRDDHVLGHGDYKHHPNSVPDADRPGGWQAAAPVDDVRAETARLVEALAGDRLARLHPAVRGAFALHGVHHVRPFAAGNGRVGRVLASVPLLETVGLPLVVFADDAGPYRRALAAADEGDPAPLVDVVRRRCTDLVVLLTGLAARAAEDEEGCRPLQRWRQRADAAVRLHALVAAAAERVLDRHRARTDLGWLSPLDGADVAATPAVGGRPHDAATVVVRVPLPSGRFVAETLSIDAHPLDVDSAVVVSAALAELRLDLELTALEPGAPAPATALEAWLERAVTALAVRVAAEGD